MANEKVSRDKFCVLRAGGCLESFDLLPDKDLNELLLKGGTMAFQGKADDEMGSVVHDQEFTKEIDEFLELNEQMAGMNLAGPGEKGQTGEMEEEDDLDLNDADSDGAFVNDPELDKEFEKTATSADKLKRRYEITPREDSEKEFEDEIEYPTDIFLSERLAKYRHLKSLRTSPWNKYDSLPEDYKKISLLDNPKIGNIFFL